MTPPLITTKFYIPQPRATWVARPHLLARLDESLRPGHKLTLISAPAGYGKTSLLTAWLAQLPDAPPVRIAWLSLDEGDNDPTRFWAYVSAALDNASIAFPETAAAPSPEATITALINAVHAAQHALILVLDDYHLLHTPALHKEVAFLVDHLPPHLHLVIASRADPPLPLARLRARGELTELRQADLRFSHGEAAHFLEQAAALDASAIATLTARTEGWIAGLQMAALAGQRALSGGQRYILDYFLEEVLHRESAAIQTFLLHTAILERLSGPLCDALLASGDADSRQVLDYLERSNLFIVPLDGQQTWYRYHHLFADLLRNHLKRHTPDLAPALHRRASAWFAAQGLSGEAIAHALKGADYERAAALIEGIAEQTLMRGEILTLAQWLRVLPDATVTTHPDLYLTRCTINLVTGQPITEVVAQLDAARAETPAQRGAVAALRAIINAFQGDLGQTIHLAQSALDMLPDDAHFLRGFSTWIISAAAFGMSTDADDEQPLTDLLQSTQRQGNRLITINTLGYLAEQTRMRGNLHHAQALWEQILTLTDDGHGGHSPLAGDALVGLATLAYEWGDLPGATRDLAQGLALAGQWSERATFEGHLALARLQQTQGDLTAAQATLDRARAIAVNVGAPNVDDCLVAMEQARLWLRQAAGDAHPAHPHTLAQVQAWALERDLYADLDATRLQEDTTSVEARLRKYELLIFARLLIAQGDVTRALHLLDMLLPLFQQRQRRGLRIEAHLLKALAHRAEGNHAATRQALNAALALGEANGYRRTFLDEGPGIIALLREAQKQGHYQEYVAYILGEAPTAAAPSTVAQSLADPLSARELEILRLLDTPLSSREIAEQCFISANTARFHIKNIYSKLDVHRRSEAVEKARELGLLVGNY